MNVIGLDISAKCCGAAIGDGSGPPRTVAESFPDRPEGLAYLAFSKWLRGLLVEERPGLVVAERALIATGRKMSAQTTRMLVEFAGAAKLTCAASRVRFVDVQDSSWRLQFLGSGKLKSEIAKAEALRLCRTLGWPTGGVADRAEAAGVWCWGHLNCGGNARAMHRMLSASSMIPAARSAQ